MPRRGPEGGDYRGEGFVDCPACPRDYRVTTTVEHDVICSVEVDSGEPGYSTGAPPPRPRSG